VPGLSRVELFLIFLKAGLAFGGGLDILAALEDELVSKRRVVSKVSISTRRCYCRWAVCSERWF
jgi:chromate transport protein ChrA